MNDQSKTARIFDIFWFASFVFLQALPSVIPSATQHPLGFFAISCLIGGAMIFSQKLKVVSVVGKMLHWFAINVMKPRSEYNHIIWGFFILIMGILSVIFSDQPSEDELDFFQVVHKSHEYWIGIIVVVVLNILVGIYTANKHKKG